MTSTPIPSDRLISSDFELNYRAPHGPPTLVPSAGLEQALNYRRRFKADSLIREETLPRCAVHLHVYFLAELDDLLTAMAGTLRNFDLFITTDTTAKMEAIERELEHHSLKGQAIVEFLVTPNRGRNLGPLLIELYPRLLNYELALHLHAKRSEHNDIGRRWLKDLSNALLGSRDHVTNIRAAFWRHPEMGLLMPECGDVIRPYFHWGDNFALAQLITKSAFPERTLTIYSPLVFPAGMMFWFRPAALKSLSEACSNLRPLPLEPLGQDGTPLHTLERLVAHCCEASGYEWALCGSPERTLSNAPGQRLSVWETRLDDYMQATAMLAAELRAKEGELQTIGLRHEQELRTVTSTYRDQLSNLEGELQGWRASLSWKLTAPLRFVSKLLRGRE